MNTKKFSEAMNEIDNKYINEAIRYKKKAKKHSWTKWGAIAACLCLVCVGGFSLSYVFQNLSQGNIPPVQEQAFVPISSLLAENNSNSANHSEKTATVPIEQYMGVYVKITSVETDILSESIGTTVSGTETWYFVSGHTDLQYLIQNDDNVYSLWKFKCFDSNEYPYSDVLKLVYQIDSADKITEIQINPATMDNTDSGKSIQAKIGTHTVTNKNEVENVYQILSSLTCYGENNWDMIDYGNVEAAADEETSSNEAVQLGRYLTLITNYGNEIDGLKYTAVSNMFYEFSGIAYNKLTEEQANSICEILHIEKSKETEQLPASGNDNSLSLQPNETTAAPTVEIQNANIRLKYITELQTKISNAMRNQELPFVSSSAVYENPYRLHVVVSSNSKDDLGKLKAFDTIGGALEIEYNETPVSNEEMEIEIQAK